MLLNLSLNKRYAQCVQAVKRPHGPCCIPPGIGELVEFSNFLREDGCRIHGFRLVLIG